ncbi:hypothetical protein KVR01_002905 [Diaporthe batatas]|uniref:uncharacterized protein n=1 Tax=Diaporthe batatas TaxID=748121 RepID=UPI001D0518CC|nr:uncharacterized protein KVR01_002905 [Diaporthe batatas]KAG8167216.1 hypothetical protein KVR01_002905 [Diaporthe batatas]
MSIPRTTKAYRRTEGDLPRTIVQTTEALPRQEELGPHDVLIKVHAVSLNYRDVAMLNGLYPAAIQDRGIPCSDCAAEVIAMGASVQDFVLGDRVAPIFDVNNFTGLEDEPHRSLGGDLPGVLREHAVYEDKLLVKLPEYLTWEEASTLTCAGVTAWNALDGLKMKRKDPVVLLQGTGGVSLFALAICIAAGIKAIITSSSDEKLEAVKKLGPDVHGINYKTTASQKDAILEITNGKGVDFVVNNSGPGSIPEDVGFLRARGGTVSLVGFLSGLGGTWDPSEMLGVMQKVAKIQ